MKHEVNRRLKVQSIPLADLVERFLLHGPIISEVETADTLMLLAIYANDSMNDDMFIEFCKTVHKLLPSGQETSFTYYLAHISNPIIPTTLRLARYTRKAHGLQPIDLEMYKETF
jgi:hypothetical protein